MKDSAKVDRSYASAWDRIVQNLPIEQRLKGLAPEEIAKALKPEQRLAGLAPEQRLAGLSAVEQVLALSDEVLRTLPEAYLATLPPEAQATIRTRLGR